MQRWYFTMGLAATAVGAAVLVPREPSTVGSPTKPASVSPQAHSTDEPTAVVHTPLSLTATLDQTALLAGSGDDQYLVFDISSAAAGNTDRQPVHLAVVMDTSGSMSSGGKLTNARVAAQELVASLRPEDTFSLITFDDRAEVVIPTGAVTDPEGLRQRIGEIRTGGGTNLFDGLTAGLQQVSSREGAGNQRVVVLSDGHANIGVTDADAIRRQAGSLVREGVTVSAMGLGIDYNEDLLAAMSDAGGGSYRFIDRPSALAGQFATELQQASTVVAHQTELTLDFAAGVELKELYGYNLEPSRSGNSVFLGDIYAGQTRKVVARVRIPDQSLGPVDVVTARVVHVDTNARVQQTDAVSVTATVTPERAVVERSVVQDARKATTRARVGQLLDAAARDYAAGDLLANQASMTEAIDLVEGFNADFEDAEMLESLARVEAQAERFAHTPHTSETGRRAVKRAKEGARAYTR